MKPKSRWGKVAAFLVSLWLMMWTLVPILRSDQSFTAQTVQAAFLVALWFYYVDSLNDGSPDYPIDKRHFCRYY